MQSFDVTIDRYTKVYFQNFVQQTRKTEDIFIEDISSYFTETNCQSTYDMYIYILHDDDLRNRIKTYKLVQQEKYLMAVHFTYPAAAQWKEAATPQSQTQLSKERRVLVSNQKHISQIQQQHKANKLQKERGISTRYFGYPNQVTLFIVSAKWKVFNFQIKQEQYEELFTILQ